jgi:hypothetical protein
MPSRPECVPVAHGVRCLPIGLSCRHYG